MTEVQSETDPLLDHLTAPQREAVTHVDGPLLVLAAAGSGKTRVITRRIAHLILRVGLAPWHVLAITFTNKAAGEMRERVATMMSAKQARATTVCTFHSLCARLLRQYAPKLGLPESYSIYDTSDQTRAIKQALSETNVSSTNFPPSKMLAGISKAKNELQDPDAFAALTGDFYGKTLAKVYRGYQAVLKKNNALDFDDLLFKTVVLMREHPDVLAELREKYQYILIDEYQDTNHAQFTIAHTLAAEHRNLCVTGDPDQSIYSWRGADIRNIMEFEQQYPGAAVVRLEQNYRSTKNILAVADKLIQNNQQRKHKGLWTQNDTGEKVRVVRCYDEQHEASYVVEQFSKLHDEKQVPWNRMAVFYRTNSLSRVMEDAFREASVPYQIARGTAFYDRKEIKDALAYLRVMANPADEVNLLRIINTPARGISDKTSKLMQAQAVALAKPLIGVIDEPSTQSALTPRAVTAVKKFITMINTWRATADPSLRLLFQRVLADSGLEKYYLADKSDPDQERIDNLRELVSSAAQFDEEYDFENADNPEAMKLLTKLTAFLERVSLVSDVDAVDADQGMVTLMTLHAAKGLEFPVVAIVGVEDGLLPHQNSQDSDRQLEEERRLCFVGITRAQQHLLITHAQWRTIFGQTQGTIPSRFLRELPSEPLDVLNVADNDAPESNFGRTPALGTTRSQTVGSVHPADTGYGVGVKVRHPQFGVGTIVQASNVGAHTRVKVQFLQAGTKTLVLQYARLEKISS